MGRRDRRSQVLSGRNKTNLHSKEDQHKDTPTKKRSHTSSEPPSPEKQKRQRSEESNQSEKNETTTRRRTRSTNEEEKEKEEIENPFRLLRLSASESLIVMKDSETIVVKGKLQIKCLLGEAEVLGFKLKPNNQSYSLFSPETNSSLYLQANKGVAREHILRELRSCVQSLGDFDGAEIADFLKECKKSQQRNSLCVLHAKKLDSSICDYISSVSIYRNVFQSTSDSSMSEHLGAQLLSSQEAECLYIPPDYKKLAVSFSNAINKGDCPTMTICGGKNVGKSTLCRYILNNSLNSCGSVAYLECDIGQTEFTPSGCLSLTVVTEPLLGPPFTHQTQPLCNMFFGALTPGDDPGRYLKCISYLVDKYQQLENRPPLMVNTIGWNKGLGISILIDTVKTILPAFVVQVDSKSRSKNMPNLTPEFFDMTPGWENIDLDAEKSFSGVSLDFKHVVLHSPVKHEQESSERYKAPDHRNLSLMAYLGQMMKETRVLCTLRPYRVPWSSVAVHVCHSPVPNSQVLGALNASVVALCTVNKSLILRPEDGSLPRFLAETPVCDCLGFGVIRSIDEVEKVFHVLTPVDPTRLPEVNCLLRGALDLPPQVFMNQQTSAGEVPYVGYPKDGIGATSNKRRRHLQRHRPSDK